MTTEGAIEASTKVDWPLLLVLCLFLVGMLLIGAWASRKQKTAADFYVGGRTFGTLTVTATQMASAFGGGLMVAHVGLGYAYGLADLAYLVALAAGVFLLAIFVADWLRRQDFYTTTDWMVAQYGDSKSLRATTSVVVMLVTMGWWVSQPIAAGKVLHALTGMPEGWGIVLAASVVIVYTMAGGIIAVAYTDLAQLGLMIFGMVVLLPIAVSRAGGFEEIFNAVPAQNLTIWAPGKAVVWGWILAVLPGQMVLQVYHQRIYAARTAKVARRALFILSASCVIAGIWASLLGMAIYTIKPDLDDKDMAMTWSVMNLMPRGVALLVVGAIVAAIISTADSALHSTAASITRDLYHGIFRPEASDDDILRFSRRCIVVVGIVGLVIGLWVPFIIKVLVLGYTLTASGMLFPLFLGWFWRGANRAGAIAGMVMGVLVAALLSCPPLTELGIPAVGPGLLASLLAMVVVSLITRGPAVVPHN
ncbi:MAG: sodium:solute symporter family protein [Proteobacteria bacterium]|nr:sodium:solute symporter family protein [Pseudomonadota bacterium]